MPRRGKAAMPGRRDLRELARSLGLGTAKAEAKTATIPSPKRSGKKS